MEFQWNTVWLVDNLTRFLCSNWRLSFFLFYWSGGGGFKHSKQKLCFAADRKKMDNFGGGAGGVYAAEKIIRKRNRKVIA